MSPLFGEETWLSTGGKEFVLRLVWKAEGDADEPSKLLLDGAGQGDRAVLEVRTNQARLLAAAGQQGKEAFCQEVAVARADRHEAWLVAKEGSLVLDIDGQRKASAKIQFGSEPRWRWEEGKACRLAEKPRVQPLSGLVLADDFMRGTGEEGLWQPLNGCWAVQASATPARAANAFRFFGKSESPSLALSKLSYWFWSDYRLGVSVESDDPQDTVGLVFYLRDDGNYHLLRWVAGERLELVRARGGKEEVLAASPASRKAGTWYRLDVVAVGDAVAGFIDGNQLLVAKDDSLLGGRIGLYVCSKTGAWFDDVSVESVTATPPPDVLDRPLGRAESDYADLSEKQFTQDTSMVAWAHPRGQWEPGQDGFLWYHCRFHHDVRFEWKAEHYPLGTGEIALFAQRERPGSGYRLRWDGKEATVSRDGKALKSSAAPAGDVSSLLFTASNGELAFRFNDGPAVQVVDAEPLTRGEVGAKLLPSAGSHWMGSRKKGMRPDWRDYARVTSAHHVEFLFDAAPAAWLAQSGTWRATNRWACAAMWSFFGGRSSDIAILWNKRRIGGDFDLDIALAPMEGSTQRAHYTWPINLCIAFCADGHSLDSGYNLLFGLSDIPSVLHRRDRVVAENFSLIVPGLRFDDMAHYHAVTRTWQRLRLRRTGPLFEVYAETFDKEGHELGMTKLFDFTDPKPLAGEHFGVWTWGANGIALARVSLSFERTSGTTAPARPEKGAPLPPSHLRVVNPASGGDFRCVVHPGPLDPAKQGLLRLRYRLERGLHLGLFVRRRMELAQFVFCGPESYQTGAIPLGRLAARDNEEWHKMTVDLRQALAVACPDDPDRLIDEVFLASPMERSEEIAGLGVNRAGASYEIADVQFDQPTSELPPRPLPSPQIHVYGRKPLDDFESGLGDWRTFGATDGALLWRDPAGARSGRFGLRLFNPKVGGTAGAQISSARFDARLFPRIRFDCLFPPAHEGNIVVRSGDQWFEVQATGRDATWPVIGQFPGIQADGQWHTTELDLAAALAGSLGAGRPLPVDALYLADSKRMGNLQGTIYRIDNFCLVPAVAKDRPTEFRLTLPSEPVAAFSHAFDDEPDTEPGKQPTGQGDALQAKVPENAAWLHVRAQNRRGEWSPTAHLPLVVGAVPDVPAEAATRTPAGPQGPLPAPRIAYIPSDRLCFNDFEWKDGEGLDGKAGGAAIRRGAWVVACLDDGATGNGCLEIINLYWDDFFSGFLYEGPFDIRRYPRIMFDYKFETAGCMVNLTGLLNKEMFVVEWLSTCEPGGYFTPYVVGSTEAGVQDGQWHKGGFDLLKMMEQSGRAGHPCLPLVAEQLNTWAMTPERLYWNPLGARLRIDNFAIYSPRGRSPSFEWKVPGWEGRKLSYVFCLDKNRETTPPEGHLTEGTAARFEDLGPGMWYFHVRAKGPDGQWGPTGHLGFEIIE
jgi:hypothetical protein